MPPTLTPLTTTPTDRHIRQSHGASGYCGFRGEKWHWYSYAPLHVDGTGVGGVLAGQSSPYKDIVGALGDVKMMIPVC